MRGESWEANTNDAKAEKIVISLRSQRRLPSTGQIWEKLFMRSLSHIGNNMTRLRNHHPNRGYRDYKGPNFLVCSHRDSLHRNSRMKKCTSAPHCTYPTLRVPLGTQRPHNAMRKREVGVT